jgi:hypothetical protein
VVLDVGLDAPGLTEQLLCGDEQVCDGLLDLGELLLGLGSMACQ